MARTNGAECVRWENGPTIAPERHLEVHAGPAERLDAAAETVHVGVDGPVAGGVAGVGQAGFGAFPTLLGHDHGRLVSFRPIGQLGDAGDERGTTGPEDRGGRGSGPACAVGDNQKGQRHDGQRQKGQRPSGQVARAGRGGKGTPPRDDTAHR